MTISLVPGNQPMLAGASDPTLIAVGSSNRHLTPARRMLQVLALALLLISMFVLGACSTPPKDESPNSTAERLYKDAREDMNAGSFERAVKSLERVEGLAAGSVMAQQALLDMAYLHWKLDDRVQGLSTVDRFIKLNPSSPALDYAMYLRGVINFNEGTGLQRTLAGQDFSERDQRASRESFQSFKQLVDQFPDSRYTPDARLRMSYIINSLASYEVHVARYYFRRGAYVAAAARAQEAVNDFQQAPVLEEALHIMAQSYAKLGLTELQAGAERVLKLNYPNSLYLGGTAAQASKPWWRFW